MPTVTVNEGAPATYNDPAMAEHVKNYAVAALGKDRVFDASASWPAKMSACSRSMARFPCDVLLGAAIPRSWKRAAKLARRYPAALRSLLADYAPAIPTGVTAMTRSLWVFSNSDLRVIRMRSEGSCFPTMNRKTFMDGHITAWLLIQTEWWPISPDRRAPVHHRVCPILQRVVI